MKRPAFQFYPGDWLKDPALRRCSPAARGVWIDMLCLMHECDDYGVLATGGSPWKDHEIAAVISGDQPAILGCLHELLTAGVAHRTPSGAIFSRRMGRDEQVRQEAAQRKRKSRDDHNEVTEKSHASSSSASTNNSLACARELSPGTARAPPKQHAADPIWDAVCAEWGYNGNVKRHKPMIGVLVRDFKTLGATPDEIARRRKAIFDTWGKGTDTARSLIDHWAEAGEFAKNTSASTGARDRAQAEEEARTQHAERRVKAQAKAAQDVLQRHTAEEVEEAYQAFLAEQQPGRVRDHYKASGLTWCSKFVADRLEPGAVDELVRAKQ